MKVTALAAATLCKIGERKAALYGLNAATGISPVTNNLLIANGDEVTYLQNLAKLKALEHGRSQPIVSEQI
jgi:hypothetical protein